MSATETLRTYGSLVKLSHTVFALPFALAAVVLAAPYAEVTWQKVALIVLCIAAARTAAMAFNRLVDRDIDAENPRTQDRELPQGLLSVWSVRALVLGACAVFVLGAALLGPLPLLLSPIALGLALGYSYTKRFTAWCHVVLGAAVAFAPGGAWIAVGAPVTLAPWLLVAGVGLWVGGFDVLYSLQDVGFDKGRGLRSIPAAMGVRNALILSALMHVGTVVCLVAVGLLLGRGPAYYVGATLISVLLTIEHVMVGPGDLSRINKAFFDINGYVSVAFLLCVAADAWLMPAPAAGAHAPLVRLEQVAEGLTSPVGLVPVPDASGRRMLVDQVGLVRVLSREGQLLEEPFLDLRERVVSLSSRYDERGLLGLAFHPEFAKNGRLFVYYSAPRRDEAPEGWDHTSRLVELRAEPADATRADAAQERLVLAVDQPQGNHNGATLAFGPDGYLYVSLGDGGGGSDRGPGHPPEGHGQHLESLLGSILRIDVNVAPDAQPYGVPSDNPFVGRKAGDARPREEIFAYGLRNPYRMSFDRAGEHGLLAADVGQDRVEAVYHIERGANYGWPIREGSQCIDRNSPAREKTDCPTQGPRGEPLRAPVAAYMNRKTGEGFGTSVIGGHVYRGQALPALRGKYVFGDWNRGLTGRGGALLLADPSANADGPVPWSVRPLPTTDSAEGHLAHHLLAFGEDADGELYVLTSDARGPTGDTGKVYRLAPVAEN